MCLQTSLELTDHDESGYISGAFSQLAFISCRGESTSTTDESQVRAAENYLPNKGSGSDDKTPTADH